MLSIDVRERMEKLKLKFSVSATTYFNFQLVEDLQVYISI